MIKADLIRELEKAREALQWTEKHLCLTNEANAALHCNERVFYSPLTTQVHEARESLDRVIEQLQEEQNAREGLLKAGEELLKKFPHQTGAE